MASAPEQQPGVTGTQPEGDEIAAVNPEASHRAATGPAAEVGGGQDGSGGSSNNNNNTSNDRNDVEEGAALRTIKTNFGDRPECFTNTAQEVSACPRSCKGRKCILKRPLCARCRSSFRPPSQQPRPLS